MAIPYGYLAAYKSVNVFDAQMSVYIKRGQIAPPNQLLVQTIQLLVQTKHFKISIKIFYFIPYRYVDCF